MFVTSSFGGGYGKQPVEQMIVDLGTDQEGTYIIGEFINILPT